MSTRVCTLLKPHLNNKLGRGLVQVALRTRRTQVSSMATQAVSEADHCWQAAGRWRSSLVDAAPGSVIPVTPVMQGELEHLSSTHGGLAGGIAAAQQFKAKPGELLLLPDTTGQLERVLIGMGPAFPTASDCWSWAALPSRLPAGTYKITLPAATTPEAADQACIGWALGCYAFDRYKKKVDAAGQPNPPRVQAQLVWPEGVNKVAVGTLADAFFWSRDLINTPAEDLGPGHLISEALAMASSHQTAKTSVIRGDDLLTANFPAIHTVGRAAARPPGLIDIRWTPAGAPDGGAGLPRLSLVGKGVCFDSGGLDIKTAAGMKFMKKDMGGAALMLALAHLVMGNNLPVQLRVLIPTVENAISGNAYRPLDVLRTRAGLTVENGNTDAEGRLILCDALYEAASEVPDLLIDAATLTGAARVALGPDLPAVFTNCDDTWAQFNTAANTQADCLWRLPLYAPYRKAIDSKVADLSSTGGEGAQGGSILAALYLQEFVKAAPRWVHIDTAGWVSAGNAGPGKPEGGEPLSLRALWGWVSSRYSGKF